MINDKGEFGKVSKIRKKKIKKTNILLGFICILLAVLLGFILVTSYKSEQKESRHLSEIADDQQSGIEDYEAVKERANELEEISSEEAEEALSGQLDKIKAIADSTLAENGCDDRTVCEITSMDIDRREYGEYTVPAGRYTALRITIGEGKGHNWWCVMYPPLCVPCAGVDMTDEEIMEKYGGELTDEDIELLTEEGYKPRLYIAELIGWLQEK